MNIGLDFDGVISDCGKLKSDAAKKLYGVEIPPEKFKKEIVIGEGHLTHEEYRKLQKLIYGTREIGFLMEPVKDMMISVDELVSLDHNLVVVTSRGSKELQIAKEWSQNTGLNIKFIGVGPDVSKADACKGLDVYIDDDLDKLEPLVGVVKNLYLFSWGYNLHVDESGVAQRVDSWKTFLSFIKQI